MSQDSQFGVDDTSRANGTGEVDTARHTGSTQPPTKKQFYCSCTTSEWPAFDKDIVTRLATSKKGYIIYLGPEGELDWHTTDDFSDSLEQEFAAVQNRVIHLRAACSGKLPDDDREEYLTLLGFGLSCAFNGSLKEAIAILDDAEEYLSIRNQRQARTWYLATSVSCALVIIAIATVSLTVFSDYLDRSIVVGAAAGTAGALLSILQRLGTTPVDFAAGKLLHVLESSGRMIAGMLGGVIVSQAIVAQFILANLAPGVNESGLILACMLGGISERLVPSLVQQVEGGSQEKSKSTSQPD